jgi:hypothetical protein
MRGLVDRHPAEEPGSVAPTVRFVPILKAVALQPETQGESCGFARGMATTLLIDDRNRLDQEQKAGWVPDDGETSDSLAVAIGLAPRKTNRRPMAVPSKGRLVTTLDEAFVFSLSLGLAWELLPWRIRIVLLDHAHNLPTVLADCGDIRSRYRGAKWLAAQLQAASAEAKAGGLA